MKKRQQGAVLLLVLILMGVFLIALAGSLGSSFGNITTVGNYAYREAALAVSDSVVADAKAFISNSATDLTTAVTGKYSPQILTDANNDGVPDNPCNSLLSAWGCVPADTTTFPGHSVQYFIERLCIVSGVITSSSTQCQEAKPGTETAGSYSLRGGNQGNSQFASYPILYRVTVRTVGPKNTAVLTQTMLSKDL
jgi:Tfp pilus assembly protein PilX